MGWVIRFIPPERARRGREGSDHPADVYAARLAQSWPVHRKLAGAFVRACFSAASIWMARGAGVRTWADLRTILREALLPRELVEGRIHFATPVETTLLSSHAKKALAATLDPMGPLGDRDLLDKLHFDRMARAAGLKLPDTLGRADLDRGLPEWTESAEALIVKPGYNRQGRGIVTLDRQGSDWRSGGQPIGDLHAWLEANLDAAGVAQRRLRTHAGLADLSPSALSTLRVVTCLDERREPEVTHLILRLGPAGAVLDNFSASGIAAPVDLASGLIGRAKYRRGRGGGITTHETHPVTGAAITGRRVPHFEEAVTLGVEAHRRLFGDRRMLIGWDIAIAEQGAVLIEGNWNPGAPTLELVTGLGVAGHRLGDLLSFHLRALPDEAFASAPLVERTGRG